MIATKYVLRKGTGKSNNHLAGFDKALIDAGVGNYNLVRLSSILPAGCQEVKHIDLQEGSLLPTAYSTISSSKKDDYLVSVIGVGKPKDSSKVGVIMEYSAINKSVSDCVIILQDMIKEAFSVRDWALAGIEWTYSSETVSQEGEECTTFACIAEW